MNGKTAVAIARNARVSLKHSTVLCREVRKLKRLDKAIRFLENLVEKKVSIDGKYYTNAAKKLLEVLKSVKANARQKNLNEERLYIKVLKADKGETFLRPRSRARFSGRRAKSTHLRVVVEEG